MSLTRWIALGAIATAAICTSIGCSDDDDKDAGGASGTTPPTTPGTPGTPPPAGETLYARLGGKSGLNDALGKVVEAELANADIASYFVLVGKPGHPPTAAAIQECLVNQLGAAAGGPESEVKYPTTVAGGFTCRSMAEAHAGLGIPPGTFDEFVMIAGAKLKELGVADADITTIAGVLSGTKADIATDTSREKGPFLGDAGG